MVFALPADQTALEQFNTDSSHLYYQNLSPEALSEELSSFHCLKHHVLNRMLKER